MRDFETGLVPKGVDHDLAYWNTKDTAADLFPFLLIASQYLDKKNENLWLQVLARKSEICGPMPRKIFFQPARIAEEDLSTVIFGASEYAKDGLLAITERSGRGPWFDRLEVIMQALIAHANVRTTAGNISSANCEVNGEMLQVLSRLYWATRKSEYLKMAENIAEAYLFDIFPNNQYLPAIKWNFTEKKPEEPIFHLRDHGSEIIPGLTELYLLEKELGRPKAERYREPLKKFLDIILKVGRTKDGLWYNTIDTNTQKQLNNNIVDTWGYILNAYKMFDIVEDSYFYSKEIKRAMQAAASKKSFIWEKQNPDGYADTIESMLYLLLWFDIPECHRWVDDEIEILFSKQLPSGFIQKHYLDGNFIRTSLLYATYKTQGILIDPWNKDVRIGAAYDKNNKELYVYLSTASKWSGLLKFDLPRHRIIWNLPFEYPRLNATPEWFVVEPKKTYMIVYLDTGEKFYHSGQSLAKGVAINLNEEQPSLNLKLLEQNRCKSKDKTLR